MSAPLVINLRDGSVWERRAVSRAGVALYALAGTCACPEYVMASEAELAELGIVGSADALPMPVGSALVSEAELDSGMEELSAYLRVRVALASAQRGRREARARIAELEAAAREFPLFYLADYEGAGLTLHLTRESARDACDDFAQAEARGRCWDWRAEDGVEFQFWTDPDNDRPTGDTGGAVWEARVEDSSGPKTYPPALPWARLLDHEDLTDFLDELAASAITNASAETALTEVEDTCGRWRLIAEAQHAHNTAPGPGAEAGEPS
ncbi:hypothetical protein ACF07F_16740 [Streptomyces sp. NPDC015237]|uniref:hypothetical protein n=1 Tax=Streptomyces sp. NPDC015237 TaxID=3364949 RepID=UPI0036FDD499